MAYVKVNKRKILFFTDYCKKNDRSYCDPKTRKMSNLIVDFKYEKHCSPDPFQSFSAKLNIAIHCIARYCINADGIVLVAAPSSSIERDKNSPLKKAVKICAKKLGFEDGSNILQRKMSIESSASCENRERNSIEQLKETTECTSKLKKNKAYILIDDVTTTGNSMRAYSSILKENGANNVVCFAFGSTMLKGESFEQVGYTIDDYFRDNPIKVYKRSLGIYKYRRFPKGIEIYHRIPLLDFEEQALIKMGWKKRNADCYYIAKRNSNYKKCEAYALKHFDKG
ncbi:phosphoribosyltransferase [Hornefia butyriciproducens]|uniref:Phosphoribosyltransferase n=1 Tax=Hornefia butyriciproducens TaxID=2652293 RepID=A0A6L5Y5Z9_9FIRM|nr:phosphoribosyltransferase [Hornefia butyriciproducens]MST52013.1 phosphoribosyltransferase [Hornefia butyriciproducens]